MYRPQTPVQFRYVTIQDLRDNGIPATELDDTNALKAITSMSQKVNELTDQWFSPVYIEEYLDGRDHRFLTMPNNINILSVDSLRFKSGGVSEATFDLIPDRDFDILERALDRKSSGHGDGIRAFPEIRNSTSILPSGSGRRRRYDFRWTSASSPYEIKGYFGNVHLTKGFGPYPTKVETTIVGALAANDTSVEVADATDLRIGDSLLIDKSVSVIVTGITPTVSPAATVSFDAAVGGAAAGSEVITYGGVHPELKRAVILLVNMPSIKGGINGSGTAAAIRQGRMLSERTDNYSYKLSDKGNDSNSGSGNYPSSGSMEVDTILNQFMAPPYIGVV